MSQRTLLPVLALLLVGADGPDEPTADAPDVSDEMPVEAEADAPQPEDDGLTEGQRALTEATRLLTERRWDAALTIAITGISMYPEQADSFRTVATIATDQIARGPVFNAPGGAQPAAPATGPGSWSSDRPLAVPADGSPPTGQQGSQQPADDYGSWRSSRWRDDRPHPAANDPREGILIGFDAGLNNGLRVEWKAKGTVVDGVGLQAGLGTWIYSGLYLAPITQAYIDFQSRSDFQFETSLGILWYSGSAYPLIGIGGQWDPPKPIQVNVGVDVGLGIFPDVSVGFLW